MKADDVRVQHLRKLIDHFRAEGHAGASVRYTISALSVAYGHGVIHLGVARNPVRELERGELPSGSARPSLATSTRPRSGGCSAS